MNKPKTLLSLSLLLLASLSSYSQYYSRVHEEYKLPGKDCRMLVYSVYLNNYNFVPTDDKLIGTYSVVFGKECLDFKNIPAEKEFIRSKTTYHLSSVTSKLELSPTIDTSILEAEKINAACYLITTDFWYDNGTSEISKDDIRLGSHHLTIWIIDGEVVDNEKIAELLISKGYNLEYSRDGSFTLKSDDPDYIKKLNEFLRSVSQ
jgi:hypothetical protein